MTHFTTKNYSELDKDELYQILKLRQEVFVIEQKCIYLDIDGFDDKAFHICARKDGIIAAYARILAPNVKYKEPSIGRVLVNKRFRNKGLGKLLMFEAVKQSQKLFPNQGNRIGAQVHLEKFYNEVGFEKVSDPYDEDGIWHIEMLLKI
jgi:ElaA protein